MSIIPLAQAKAELGVADGDSSFDLKIHRLLEAAEETVAARIGPLNSTIVIEDVTPSNGVAVLSRRPVQSVTSVTVSGVATTDFALRAGAGLLYVDWPVTVTYVAGFAVLPALVQDVVLELTRLRFTTRPESLPRDVDVAEEGNPLPFPLDETSILARLDIPHGRTLSVG